MSQSRCCFSSGAVPDVADVGEQHGEVSEAQGLLLGRQAQFGNGPDQSVDHRVQQTQQLVPALQLLGRLRGARTQICNIFKGGHVGFYQRKTNNLPKYWANMDLLLINIYQQLCRPLKRL